MLKNKKFIIILIIVLLILAITTIVYFVWFKKMPETSIEDKPIQKLTDEKIMGAKFLSESNKIRFLSLDSFTLKELDLNSKQIIELTKTPLYLVKNIIWSPDSQKVILKVENNRALLSQEGYLLDKKAADGTITTWSFDLSSNNLIELPLEVGEVGWLNNDKIIYYYSKELAESDSNDNNAFLTQANYDGSNYQKIMDLDGNKLYNPKLSLSPDKDKIILSPEAEGIGNNSIFIVDIKTKTINEISEDGLTVLGSWSEGGKNIFLYQTNQESPDSQIYELWFANKEGVDKKKLGLSTAYPLVITDNKDKNIYLVSTYNNRPAVFQVNSGSLEKKIIAGADNESTLNNITQIGLLNNNIFIVADEIIYSIKTE